jgi:hypothetical protein
MDPFSVARPNAHRVQLDLFHDYRTNPALYPTWQAFLRDLPDAELVRVDSGPFAVEDCLDQITASILRFYDTKVRQDGRIAGCGLSWARKSFLRSPALASAILEVADRRSPAGGA